MKLEIQHLQMMWISTIKISFGKLLCLFLCLTLLSKAYGANEELHVKKIISYDSAVVKVRPIPPEELNKLLEDSDYSYNKVSKAPKTIFEKIIQWLVMKLAQLTYTKAGKTSLGIIEYVLIACAIGLVIFLLLKNNIRWLFYGKSASAPLDFTESIEDIHEINFEQRIADEVSKRDFRKAIRLHFLKVIKELSEQKLINWQLDKTNTDYSRELRNSKYSKEFEELSRLYEYIWYGDFKLDETDFITVIQKFNQFKIKHVS